MKNSDHKIPLLPGWLLGRLLPDMDNAYLEGDFEELYAGMCSENGKFKAGLWLWGQIIKSVPGLMRESYYGRISMLKNYLKIAFRNLKRSKIQTLINVFGLSTGVACCILIYLYINDELTYDRFHERAESIYEIKTRLMFGTDAFYSEPSGPLGPALASDYPEVESYVRINNKSVVVKYGDRIFEEDVMYTDQSFFEFFNFRLMMGDPETILNEPKAIVITENISEKYFGDENPIGKTLLIRDNNGVDDYIVRGIAEDPPGNSSIVFNFVLNFKQDYIPVLENWGSQAAATFIRVTSMDALAGLDVKIEELVKRNSTKTYSSNISWALNSLVEYHLDPGAVALSSTPPSDIKYSYILSTIAAFILIIACFNFMNLSIGGASNRLKEIGMRKVMGALRKQLKSQFWFESLIMVFFAVITGIGLAALFLPDFNSFTMKSLEITSLLELKAVLFILVLLMFTGVIAGSYPSMVFSRFSVNEMFKKKLRLGGNNVFTKSLILIQFCFSIFLIISTITMQEQQGFMQNKDLGFNDSELLSLRLLRNMEDEDANNRAYEFLKNEFAGDQEVLSVSASSASMMTEHRAGIPYQFENGDYTLISVFFVDPEFLNNIDFKFIEKSTAIEETASGAGNTLFVNEAFCRIFNVEDPIGKTLKEALPELRSDIGGDNPVIVGVLEDFHFASFKYEITPLMFFNKIENVNHILFRLKDNHTSAVIERIKEKYSVIAPDQPFLYSFVDDDLASIHVNDRRWSRIITIAAFFAIFIACLGLFGLTLLTVAGKMKEIGIRKVLGASVSGIITIVNREFLYLILAANIFAWPAAYYVMNMWLEDFAYRINISLLVFLAAGLTAFMIALFTISIHAVKAARMNPVDTIRYE
ncbi:MAG: FtsX-like permease family protein [bacterium]|nr:FtsX-like permease family protein [bacterium]